MRQQTTPTPSRRLWGDVINWFLKLQIEGTLCDIIIIVYISVLYEENVFFKLFLPLSWVALTRLKVLFICFFFFISKSPSIYRHPCGSPESVFHSMYSIWLYQKVYGPNCWGLNKMDFDKVRWTTLYCLSFCGVLVVQVESDVVGSIFWLKMVWQQPKSFFKDYFIKQFHLFAE